MDALASVGLALIVSIITAWATVRLSFRQFRSERLWERKESLYSTLIEHLATMRFVLSERYADQLSEKKITDERWYELNGQFLDAREAVSRAAATGSFILSPEAVSELEGMITSLDSWRSNPIEDTEAGMMAISEALTKLRDVARKEMKV